MTDWTTGKPNAAGLFWVRRPDNKLSLVNVRIGGPAKVVWHEGDDLPTLRDIDDPAYAGGWQALKLPDVTQPIKKAAPTPRPDGEPLTAAAQANRDNPTRPVPVERPDQANRQTPERTADQAHRDSQTRQQTERGQENNQANRDSAARQQQVVDRQNQRQTGPVPNRSGETPGT